MEGETTNKDGSGQVPAPSTITKLKTVALQYALPVGIGAGGAYAGILLAKKYSEKNKNLFGIAGFVIAAVGTWAIAKYGTQTDQDKKKSAGFDAGTVVNPNGLGFDSNTGVNLGVDGHPTIKKTVVIAGVTHIVPPAGKPTQVPNGWLCGNGLVYKTSSCQGSPVPSTQL